MTLLETEIAGQDLRHFFKLLQFLHKIGPTLYIDANDTDVLLSTLSDSKSAYTVIHLSKSFFHTYTLASTSPLQCCLPLIPLLTIFKGKPSSKPSTVPPISKHLDIQPDLVTSACKLTISLASNTLKVEFTCTQTRTCKSFELHLVQGKDCPQPVNTKQTCPHWWSVMPDVLVQISQHFHAKCEDIVLHCTPTKLSWQTVTPDIPQLHGASHGMDFSALNSVALMSSAVDMPVDQVHPYHIQFDDQLGSLVEVCFGWKEFKVMLMLADFLGEQISAHFSGPGAAIIFSVCRADIYHIDLVLATVQNDTIHIPTHTPASQPRKPDTVHASSSRTGRQPNPSTLMKENIIQTDPFAFPTANDRRPPVSAVMFPFSTPVDRQSTLVANSHHLHQSLDLGKPCVGTSFSSKDFVEQQLRTPKRTRSSFVRTNSPETGSTSDSASSPTLPNTRARLMF